MGRIGYTLMCEQTGPKDLVRHAVAAEGAGFDFEVMSDHYFPWLDEQGHSPYAWAVLGAVAHATSSVELMTYVTCPTMRYHPAVVAQKAATIGLLSDDRFTLGLGAGENLNEHIAADGWPPANVRQELLVEAMEIITQLFDGGYVDYTGHHFRVDSAKLWDLPARRVEIGAAVSGKQGIERFAPLADHLIAVEPEKSLVEAWDGVRSGSRKIGQMPVCFDASDEAATQRAHEQFRWFGGGWKVNAELPGTAGFAAASQFVRPEDVAESIPCGSSVDAIVKAAQPYWDAGFTDLALVQIGGDHQEPFLEFCADLLPALRAAAPA